jgi:hypothetical protein
MTLSLKSESYPELLSESAEARDGKGDDSSFELVGLSQPERVCLTFNHLGYTQQGLSKKKSKHSNIGREDLFQHKSIDSFL